MIDRKPTVEDLKKRIERREEVVKGFEREFLIISAGNDPMLYLERQAYLAALRAAVAGCEEARITLAKAGASGRRNGVCQVQVSMVKWVDATACPEDISPFRDFMRRQRTTFQSKLIPCRSPRQRPCRWHSPPRSEGRPG
jgi:hypothetical protein